MDRQVAGSFRNKWVHFCFLLVLMAAQPVWAKQPLPFRIGTGGSAGTYFPIGSLIAQGISGRTAANSKIPDLLALSQRSNGSAANVADIGAGLLEAGLAQADVVHWAFHGVGAFSDQQPMANLRTVATLYFESLHLIVRAESEIFDVNDLVGKRVSVDEIGSGTQLNVQEYLHSQDIDSDDLQLIYLKPVDALDRLRSEQLDALFIVAGYPVSGLTEVIAEGVGRIVPIQNKDNLSLARDYPFFTVEKLPAKIYGNTEEIETLAVPAQLVVNADLDEELIYRITELLWSRETQQLLSAGHPKGGEVDFMSALVGLSAPLHPGAERYYRQHSHPYFNNLKKINQ